MDTLCRVTGNLQNQEHKVQSHISTSTVELYANSLKQLLYSYTYEETYLAVRFTKVFFVNVLMEKLSV